MNTTTIRVHPEDLSKMRGIAKDALLKKYPELKGIPLTDPILFNKILNEALNSK